MVERERLRLETAAEWEAWLDENHATSTGVVLMLAKKSSSERSPTQPEALDAALMYGWIDAVRNALDDDFYLQTYTPRSKRSPWSIVNQKKVAALIAAGRMKPSGQAEIDRAKEDGRWEAAYAGSATITEPDDLRAALDDSPAAKAFYATLTSQNRYAILFRLHQAKRVETRARNLAKFIAQLEAGETIYPQKKKG